MGAVPSVFLILRLGRHSGRPLQACSGTNLSLAPPTATQSLWLRFQPCYLRYDDLDSSININRIRFPIGSGNTRMLDYGVRIQWHFTTGHEGRVL